jgi:hypothetical protein
MIRGSPSESCKSGCNTAAAAGTFPAKGQVCPYAARMTDRHSKELINKYPTDFQVAATRWLLPVQHGDLSGHSSEARHEVYQASFGSSHPETLSEYNQYIKKPIVPSAS